MTTRKIQEMGQETKTGGNLKKTNTTQSKRTEDRSRHNTRPAKVRPENHETSIEEN